MKGWKRVGLHRAVKLFPNGHRGEIERENGRWVAMYGGRLLGDADSADWAVDLVEAYHYTVRR